MAISSLSNSPYTSIPTSQPNSENSSLVSSNGSGSISSQLLAALTQSQASSSSPSNSLLQDLVSLSPAALGQPSGTPQTYNAQGLLQQVESNMLLNDPMFQSDATSANNTSNDSFLQSLMTVPQLPSAITGAPGAQNPAASANSGSAVATTQTQTPATTAGSTDLTANWAQLLKQDPALANVLVQSAMEQGALSMLG